ncbi:MAG: TonB-dependent receptor [Lautropia sp.]
MHPDRRATRSVSPGRAHSRSSSKGVVMVSTWSDGLLHPLHGSDHLIAMIAVGIWAVQFGRRGGWTVAVAFALALPLGAVAGLGAGGNAWTATIESAVAASTIALALACLSRPSRASALALVAGAGLLHGFVHGAEAGAATLSAAWPYFAGMMITTLALHLTGAALGRALQSRWLAWRLAPPLLGGGLFAPSLAPAQTPIQTPAQTPVRTPAQTPAAPAARALAERSPAEVELAPVTVTGNYDNAVGTSNAASAGRITSNLLATRPALRPAEILEYVPGLIVTQHSGDGKANQYFLRGFNLDHGTDFATWVDGMPVNLPTHAHGHGYTDLNFLIPELADAIEYEKGPYRAASGDFASAGSARIALKDRLPGHTGAVTLGSRGYRRVFAGYSPQPRDDVIGGRNLLIGVEAQHYDGPWAVAQDHHRLNGMLRLSEGTRRNGWSATLMGYDAKWTATDQVAQRAVDSGVVGRFGSLDPTTGGKSSRYSASGNWQRPLAGGSVQASLYAIRYSLNLYSNFTYFLDNPDDGDQFEQQDRRRVYGLKLGRTWNGTLGGRPMSNELGVQGRLDRIDVGLFDTTARVRTATTRDDRVRQRSLGVYGENTIQWSDRLRSVAGLRADRYDFRVAADLAENTGRSSDSLLSPKLSLVAGPWASTEAFLNWGRGFHSNDARGTVTRFDPKCARSSPLADCAVDPVPGLVQTTGYEVGVRTEAVAGLQSSLSLWRLDVGSELVFVGDAGTTEPSRPSRRQGIEWSNRYVPVPWLLFDADLAWSRSRFRDGDPAGDAVPGAVSRVASLAVTIRDRGPWSATFGLRHLGPRPLIEDRSVVARSFTLANLRVAYRFDRTVEAALDVFNLFDRHADDITYYYESRLRNEPGAVADRHFHPVEPRLVRMSVKLTL